MSEVARTEERKVVTVLFADLVGSTTLADGRDPERVARILGRYAATMREALESWGGTVEKYIGDAVVAAFGVPAVHEDDASRALHAALEMLERLETLNDELENEVAIRLALRIGVNTGDVLAATAGRLDQRFLAGDAVNVAARLEQAAETGAILVAERTAGAAAGSFRFGAPQPLELKGKGAPVSARRLLGVSAEEALPGSLQAPLFGRDRELRALHELLDDAIRTGTPRLALVLGPAGIGKSRLVREFLAQAETRVPELRVLRGRCRSTGQGITYWALGEIVRQACAIALDDSSDAARAKLERTVGSLFEQPGEATHDADDVIFALATTAGISLPDNPLARIRPIAVAAALGQAWPRFATAEARRAPTAFFVEDLHWADDQLLATLQHIAHRSDGPLLVLATARPEFAEDHPGFAISRDDASSLSLRPLEEGDEEQLIEGLLGWQSVPAGLRRALLDRAEGNPFFLEQLVGGLIDSGALTHDGDGWRVTNGAMTAALPDTIHAVLAARIDRLAGPEKLGLQEAAVVGRTFWPAAIDVSIEDGVVGPALAGLEAKGFVLARPSSSVAGQREYLFKHALVRDVAYAGIPLARRARSHARVAVWLEGLTGRGDVGVIELVAYHYLAALLGEGADLAWTNDPLARADVRDGAFRVLLAAGAAARQRNATGRGLELHEAALELAIDDGERASAYEELGDDHGWSYHGDPSVEAWTMALELQRTLGNDEACARICLKAARHCAIYWGGFASRPSGKTIDRFVDEGLARSQEPLTRAWLLAIRALASGSYAALGQPDPEGRESRIAAAEEAAAIAAEIGNGAIEALATRSLGGLYLEAGQPERSLALAEDELAMMSPVVVLRDRLVHTSLALARIMDIGGDFERALALAEGTKTQASHESAHERMHATYFVMAPLYRLGRWSEIVPLIGEHLAAFAEETVDMNCPFTRGGPAIGALVLERLGQDEAARDAATRIVPNNEQPGIVEAWMAERALLAGQPGEAREIAERTLAFGRGATMEEPPYELAVLVEALAALEDWPALAAVLPAARERAGYLAWLAPAIDRAEAARLAAEGDREAAQAALDRALETYVRLGMEVEVARTQERLEALGEPAT
jgi:class 3 adenylate cyclase/tetratricopeptide (TPR) repeat protein